MADDDMIRALKVERAGYVQAGKTDRVEQVDAELARLGHVGAESTAAEPAAAKRREAAAKEPAKKDAGTSPPAGRTAPGTQQT